MILVKLKYILKYTSNNSINFKHKEIKEKNNNNDNNSNNKSKWVKVVVSISGR